MNVKGRIAMKAMACVLSAAMIAMPVGAAYAIGSQNKDAAKTKVNTDIAADKTSDTNDNKEVSKDETVYILSNADGSVRKIIVSDWMKNALNESSIKDYSELNDVTNVKGDEEFSKNDNSLVWDADGNDIYYQGTIEKALPVDMTIKYTLDGKEISPDELAGKSGKVTIRFEYKNNQKETVDINGKKTSVYVPFVMISGTVLDNDVFSNVEVTNGKLISDGNHSFVVGYALPGMQESLNIDKDKLEIPDYFEISADVTNFELVTTLTIATNEIFNNVDIDEDADLSDIEDAIKQLSDASKQLLEGSQALYDGMSTLSDKSGDLVSGINQLTDGAKTLKDGTDSLYSGSSDLADGADSLNAGLAELAGNNSELVNGSKTVFESLLSVADSQLAAAGLSVPKLTIENYAIVLDSVSASLDENTVRQMAYNTALSKVTAAVHAKDAEIKAGVEAAYRKQITEGVLSAVGQPMTAEQYQQACEAGLISQEMQAQIEAAVSAKLNSSDIQAAMQQTIASKTDELIQQNMQSEDVQSQIEAAVTSAKNGQGSIAALRAQLDSYNKFYTGLAAYTNGVSQAYNGAGQLAAGAHSLKDGAAKLAAGAGTLYDGLSKLQSGSGALVDGISQLNNGAHELTDGISEFNEQGINKIVDAFDGDISELTSRMKAILDASKNYNNFAGISDKMNGSVKFIYRTDSIEKSDEE